MRAAVERMAREEPFDAVLFSGKRTYPAIAGLRGIPLVADMCDATSVRFRGAMRYSGLGKLPALGLEYLRVRSVERRLAREASHLLFASCRDREAIAGAGGNHATVVPNGVDLDYWSRSSGKLGRDTIVMTGAMDYAPNLDAALHLIEEILPRVRGSVPAARLLIVGRDAPPRLVEAGKRFGACVTGWVPDVRPYLERASVFAAPLRFGAGIQNKLLEAMAMGVPVVASPLAAEGLRTEEGHVPPVAVAGSAEEFAAQIVRKLAEARNDPAPCDRSRSFVEQNFVWARSTSKLEEVIAAVVARPAP
jgi:glycosyltransferase involved in cell wall biosynthesis